MFNKSIAALSLTLLAAAPAVAQTYTLESQAAYEECKTKDTEGQVLGAVVGGLLGGVIGNEVEKGEGTVIGGAAGAYAGTRVANKDCEALLVPTYDTAYNEDYGIPDEYLTYDAASGRYIDNRTGEYVEPLPGTYDVRATPRTSVAGAVERTPNGMVRVTDPETGAVAYVSQADYDRYYRR